MNRESLDTNAVLRFLLADIPAQYKKVAKLLSDTKTRFEIADIALMEIVFVLESHYKFTRPQIVRTLSMLNKLPNISYNDAMFALALKKYLHFPALSFDDCCLVAYAGLNEAVPLWTFDRKLAKQSAEAKEIK
jgi:predicted nucleic-acid-binding protein